MIQYESHCSSSTLVGLSIAHTDAYLHRSTMSRKRVQSYQFLTLALGKWTMDGWMLLHLQWVQKGDARPAAGTGDGSSNIHNSIRHGLHTRKRMDDETAWKETLRTRRRCGGG